MNRDVLFISHEASRTGAPIVLLHFLRWLRDEADVSFEILLKQGGELESEFAAVAPTYVLDRGPERKGGLFEPALRRFGRGMGDNDARLARVASWFTEKKFGLVYSNTGVNGEVLHALKPRCPVICHVHELEYIIRYHGLDGFRHVKTHTQRYIGASEAVRVNLVQNHRIRLESIDVVHEFISIQHVDPLDMRRMRAGLLKQLGVSGPVLIVGGSGTTDWRKGADLFVQLAGGVRRRRLELPVHFVWVGGEREEQRLGKLRHDVEHLDMQGFVHFLGAQPKPLDFFAAFDVFALVSREDPFPLVMLEAGSVGKPIVGFDGSGGAKEFIEADCGFVVPYLDMQGMIDSVCVLLRSSKLRQGLGEQAAKKVRERHDVEVAGPKLLGIIKDVLRGIESVMI